MSTNKTPNYNMNSWLGTDYVKRDEFNENFTIIDTELKDNKDTAASDLATHAGKQASSDTNLVKEKHIANNDYKNWEDHRANTNNPHGVTIAQIGAAATAHVHSNATSSVSGFMSTTDKSKFDGISVGANKTQSSTTNGNIKIDGTETVVYTHPAAHAATMITEDTTHRFVTDTDKTNWNGKAPTTAVTTSVNGLMISTDKTKLDGVSTGANKTATSTTNGNVLIDGIEKVVYTHPANHPPSIITQDSSNRFVSDTEKTTWNGKASTTAVTTGANGLMIAADKSKLDGMMAAISATLPATIGWYRIATSAVDIGRNSGRFEIDWTLSGNHGQVILNAGVMYGTDVSIELNQLQYAPYVATAGLTQARIIYHNTNTANYAYLEVYNASAAAIVVNVQMFSSLGWSLITPSTVGSIPTGYKSVNLTFISGISTAGQFRSDVASGTAPMVITSTTVIPNLNADMVDGAHAGNAANNVLKLDAGGLVPTSNMPTATGAALGGVKVTSGNGLTFASGIVAHDTTDGSKHIPANGTTNNGKFLQATGTAGTYQWAAISSTASSISITDTGSYYTSTDTEGALQEIGQTLNSMRGNLISSTNSILGM